MPSARKLQNKVERSWRICASIISRDCATWKRQRTLRPGQDDVPLGDAQRLAVELVAVVDVDVDVAVPVLDLQTPVPQRARGERVRAFAADLEIDAGIGLDEPLVGRLAIEADLAVGADFRRRRSSR